jgi:maltose alpha-D-glucosyltransferase/alpha-amylase
MIRNGPFSIDRVNVADQSRDPGSLFSAMERMIRVRKEHPAFGEGDWQVVTSNDPAVFIHACRWQQSLLVTIHNLADNQRRIAFELADAQPGSLFDLLTEQCRTSSEGTHYHMDIEAYGSHWLRFERKQR